MRGTPLEGRLLAFALQVEMVFGVGALVFALSVEDFLARAVAWAVFGVVGVQTVRTIRSAVRLDRRSDRPRTEPRFWG